MNKETYKTTMRILCLILSAIALACSLTTMAGFFLFQNSELIKVLLLPSIIVCMFFVVATTLFAFINLASKLGKTALILDVLAIACIITSFILLY